MGLHLPVYFMVILHSKEEIVVFRYFWTYEKYTSKSKKLAKGKKNKKQKHI